jgi:hypothetical protein
VRRCAAQGCVPQRRPRGAHRGARRCGRRRGVHEPPAPQLSRPHGARCSHGRRVRDDRRFERRALPARRCRRRRLGCAARRQPALRCSRVELEAGPGRVAAPGQRWRDSAQPVRGCVAHQPSRRHGHAPQPVADAPGHALRAAFLHAAQEQLGKGRRAASASRERPASCCYRRRRRRWRAWWKPAWWRRRRWRWREHAHAARDASEPRAEPSRWQAWRRRTALGHRSARRRGHGRWRCEAGACAALVLSHAELSCCAQASRLRRAPLAGFTLLRRAVTSCAAVVRSASAVAVPPLMFAAAPGLLLGSDAEVAAPQRDSALAFPRMYEVREGDTLWAIALGAYGDGSRYTDVLAANPGASGRASCITRCMLMCRDSRRSCGGAQRKRQRHSGWRAVAAPSAVTFHAFLLRKHSRARSPYVRLSAGRNGETHEHACSVAKRAIIARTRARDSACLTYPRPPVPCASRAAQPLLSYQRVVKRRYAYRLCSHRSAAHVRQCAASVLRRGAALPRPGDRRSVAETRVAPRCACMRYAFRCCPHAAPRLSSEPCGVRCGAKGALPT